MKWLNEQIRLAIDAGDPSTAFSYSERSRARDLMDILATASIDLPNAEAKRVLEITDSTSDLIYLELPVDDPVRRKPDISLARSAVGWQPSVDLEAGLRQTIASFDGVLTTT